MKRYRRIVGGLVSLGLAMLLSACVTSEREARERLDLTGEIIQQANSLFAADKTLSQHPVAVDGFKGNMRLKGRVATETDRSRAEKIVWALRGVKSVQNDLTVGGDPTVKTP